MAKNHKGIDPNKIWAWFTPEKRRAYYLLLTAISALLVAWGIIDQEAASQWLGIAGMILVGGTAASHAQRFDPEAYQRAQQQAAEEEAAGEDHSLVASNEEAPAESSLDTPRKELREARAHEAAAQGESAKG